MATKSKASATTKKASEVKKPTELKTSEAKTAGAKSKEEDAVKTYRCHTDIKSIIIEAKTESEAKATAKILLLQHGEYSEDNKPVITHVEEMPK